MLSSAKCPFNVNVISPYWRYLLNVLPCYYSNVIHCIRTNESISQLFIFAGIVKGKMHAMFPGYPLNTTQPPTSHRFQLTDHDVDAGGSSLVNDQSRSL